MSVELSGAEWFKSSYSGGDNNCVEIAHVEGGLVGVRDSKNAAGPALLFASGEWTAFAEAIRGGEFARS
ncbi:DUF397 domain-containing protein [Nocardia asteroides]|uniref:DUF397 domain-containing protein n=1 Tax=Nocardia asteroides TaxID=1824 RepID=UPI001E600FD3|nr:DUF397 domain-containing protein [Nocardia asteroides]UGT62172.1 DUF397 domain-containing protein [Nocardia asteroides]